MYPLQTGPVPRDHDNGIQGQYSTGLGAVLQTAHRHSQRGNQHRAYRQIAGQQHSNAARQTAQHTGDGQVQHEPRAGDGHALAAPAFVPNRPVVPEYRAKPAVQQSGKPQLRRKLVAEPAGHRSLDDVARQNQQPGLFTKMCRDIRHAGVAGANIPRTDARRAPRHDLRCQKTAEQISRQQAESPQK